MRHWQQWSPPRPIDGEPVSSLPARKQTTTTAEGVRGMLGRVLGISAGAQLAILVSILIAQVAPSISPQQAATSAAIRWGLFILFAILGSGTWALSRPPGLKPYFSGDTRFPVIRMVFTGFSWGMFALVVSQWRGWGQELSTAVVFLVALGWEFMMIAVVWVGQRFSSNPVQFWRDLKAGRALREREDLDDTAIRDRDHDSGPGKLH